MCKFLFLPLDQKRVKAHNFFHLQERKYPAVPAKFHNSALVSFEWNIFWAEALCDWNLLSMKIFESRASSENTLRHIFGSRTWWGERTCKFSFIWICRDDQSISKHRTKVCDIYCEMKKPLCHGDETRIIFRENRIVNYVVWISRVFDGEGSSIASATASVSILMACVDTTSLLFLHQKYPQQNAT